MMEKVKSLPALRFPGFDGEWTELVLGDFADIKTGPFGSTLHQEDYVEDGTPIVTVEHLSDYGLVHNNMPMVSDDDRKRLKSYSLKHNDIVFSRVGSVDRNSLIKRSEEGWLFSGRLLRIRPDNQVVNASYLSKIFQADRTKYRIRSVAVGQTMASLNTEILKNFTVVISRTLPEQNKIATFLTAVDDKIQQLSKKKALLEQYKKGVMQQLFSQKLRFKDDEENEFPEWKESRLGNVGEIIGGGTPETFVEEYWGGEIIWFTPTELKSKYVTRSTRRITAVGLANSSAKMLPRGTILLSSRATVGDVSIAMVDCCTNQGFQSIVVNSSNANEFIYYWLLVNKHLLLKKASGSTFLEINKTEIAKLPILLPALAEQTKIARFLSGLDDKIRSVSQQIELTRQFKKGLLQQMFV